MLKKAHKKDAEKSEKFYKLVKYVKQNKHNLKDSIVLDFVQTKGFDPDLIEIPAEFEDLPIADVKPKDFARRQNNKRFVRSRTENDITNFDAWRCHDRSVHALSPKHPSVAKFLIAPSLLLKTFGIPDSPRFTLISTGEYNFEDNNLDCYRLYDYKQTILFHGVNREEEYYASARNLRKPIHKRKRAWPTVEEFWNSEEPHEFRLCADEQAQLKKFRYWFRTQLAAAQASKTSFEERVLAKHGPKIDISLGRWEDKGVINTEMAVHKVDVSQYLSKNELKDYPYGPIEPCVPPKMFDLSKGTRVYMTKEELNRLKQEKEAATKANLKD